MSSHTTTLESQIEKLEVKTFHYVLLTMCGKNENIFLFTFT